MDLRLHERLPADGELRVTNLSRREQAGRGWILDVSKTGVALLLRMKLAAGDLVQLDIADCELFGHVIHVEEDGGSYRTGVEVEQVLLGRSDLTRLFESLSDDAGKAAERAPAE